MSFEDVLRIVNTGGVVALLLFQGILFLRGDIVPSALLERIIKATVISLLDELERLQRLEGRPPKE